MSQVSLFRSYLSTAFRWQRGRQRSGYEKMLLLTGKWPLPFDVYLLRFRVGSEIRPHTDRTTEGRHYRLNVVVWRAFEGGELKCQAPLFETDRIKYFRPDISAHSVSRVVRGSRYVLSVGWLRSAHAR